MQLTFLSHRRAAVLAVTLGLVLLGNTTSRMGGLSKLLPGLARVPPVEQNLLTHKYNSLSSCRLCCACLTS